MSMLINQFAHQVEQEATRVLEEKEERVWSFSGFELAKIITDELQKDPEVQQFQAEHNIQIRAAYSCVSTGSIQLEMILAEDDPLTKVVPRANNFFMAYIRKKKIKCRTQSYFVPCGMKDYSTTGDLTVVGMVQSYYNVLTRTVTANLEKVNAVYEMMRKHNLSVDDLREIAKSLRTLEQVRNVTIWGDWGTNCVFDKKWQEEALLPAAKKLGLDIQPITAEE